MEPMKFVALDQEDLEVISTHLQDATVKVADVKPGQWVGGSYSKAADGTNTLHSHPPPIKAA